MLVSFNWLKEYLDLSDVDPFELGQKLSLTGIEVETIHQAGQDISGILVGEVVDCQAIPDTHLHATRLDVGRDSLQEVVCGADNIKAGQKVIVAMPGAVLAGGFEIKERQMQGHPSNGMICSLQELGFREEVIPKQYLDGIYVFPDEVEVGQNAKELLGLDDVIYDFDLTPNRADALSLRGVAHEVGAILSQKPTFPELKIKEHSTKQIDDYLQVKVEDPADAPIYQMRMVEDLEVKESPVWLQRKLMASGMRPIDNLVDITNYIMLEYGQPLHAFDYDEIQSNKISVRRAQEEESLTTLDGKERQLDSQDILITDDGKPIGLAGVMGGENSQITDQTKQVALEAAVFDPVHIRRTASSLHLRSEASARFEKGINPAVVEEALNHAAILLAELGQGQILKGIADDSHGEIEEVNIPISLSYLNRVIGADLTKVIVFDILDRLGFDYEDGPADELTVSIPPRRWDIHIKADLAEEIARIYGYNNIPNSLPITASQPGQLNDMQRLIRHTNRHMQSLGFNQAINYSLTSQEQANAFALRSSLDTSLSMPLSEEHQTLRKSLIPALLADVQYNQARGQNNIFLYESGRVYHAQAVDELLDEEEHLAAIASGQWFDDWMGQPINCDFYSLKGVLQSLLKTYHLKDEIRFKAINDMEGMHPGRTALIYLADDLLGVVGQVHPTTASQYDLEEIYVFEISLKVIHDAAKADKLAQAIPKYPGIKRDVALVVDLDLSHRSIVDLIKQVAGPYLQEVRLFDYYQGENIAEEKKSMAYSLFYQNPHATLLEDEIQKDFDQVVQALKDELNAEIR